MSKKTAELGGFGDYDGDFLGLDEFGSPMGTNPMWGAALGATLQTGVALGVRKYAPARADWSEGFGALAGVAAGAALYFMGGTRAMGVTTMLTSAITGGLRQLAHSTGLMGGLGVATIEPGYAVRMNGLGIATMEPGYPVQGALNGAVHGLNGARPELLGQSDRQAQLLGMGGPAVSGLANAYGATIFGGN